MKILSLTKGAVVKAQRHWLCLVEIISTLLSDWKKNPVLVGLVNVCGSGVCFLTPTVHLFWDGKSVRCTTSQVSSN